MRVCKTEGVPIENVAVFAETVGEIIRAAAPAIVVLGPASVGLMCVMMLWAR